jgi:hypothetical protein
MQDFIIKVGSLNSLNSLYSYLGPAINEVRNRFVHGNFAEIKFDLRNLIYQKINITALTAFLSTSRKIREATGKPIELIFNWEPQIFAFLTDIGFFSIAKALDIFYWDQRMVGGFKSGVTNPNTKIIYFSDHASMGASDRLQIEELITYKSQLKQKIMPNFVLRCSEIMSDFQPSLINTVTNSAIELIVNSLVHGQDIAIVGLQRSSKRITVSVSDGGIGFKKSILKTFGQQFVGINHAQALLIGSLIQKREHGLRLAIEEVLNFENVFTPQDLWVNDGWVILSSFDCELRWQKPNWAHAKQKFDSLEAFNNFPTSEEFLGNSAQKLDSQNIVEGYWKLHSAALVGTRITFEIPL